MSTRFNARKFGQASDNGARVRSSLKKVMIKACLAEHKRHRLSAVGVPQFNDEGVI